MKLFSKTNRIVIVIATLLFVLHTPLFSQQEKADSLRKLLNKKPGDYKLTAQLYEAIKKWDRDSASRFVTNLLISAEDKQDSLFIGLAYNLKATSLADVGNASEAVPFYKKTLLYVKNRKDSAGCTLRANTNRNYGLALSDLGKYNEAEPFYQKSLDGYLALHDSVGILNTYLVFGQLEKDRGNYEKALSLLFTGLKIGEKRNDYKGVGKLMNNIANVYNGQEKYRDAIAYYQQSIQYKLKAGLKADIGNTYGNIGVAYYQMKIFDTALVYYRMALPIKIASNDKKGTASTINNIGLLYMEEEQFDSAEFYVSKSLALRIAINDETGIASSQNSLASIYYKTNHCAKAIPLLLSSIKISRKNGARETLEASYRYATDAYGCAGDYKSAFEYGNLYRALHDSLTSATILRQSEEMKAKYESDKQEEKIKNLQKEKEAETLIRDAKEATQEATQRQRQYIGLAGALIALLVISFLIIRQRENSKSKIVLQKAYNEIETKNKNITDSILYAKRIQQSILPNPSDFKRIYNNSFIYYNPKDIVSGDFYWIHVTPGGQKVIAVADCTGHGVPGAFMSVMGSDILSQATNNKSIDNPAAALHFLDEGVRQQLKQTGGDDESRDGMDIAIVLLDERNLKLQFSGALRPLFIVRKGNLMEFSAARFTIGGAFDGKKQFTNHNIDLEKDDMIYLFTDGFGDQFGGPIGKKFKTARMKELFISIADLSENEQQLKLKASFDNWKNNLEQVDDVCVVGIRV